MDLFWVEFRAVVFAGEGSIENETWPWRLRAVLGTNNQQIVSL